MIVILTTKVIRPVFGVIILTFIMSGCMGKRYRIQDVNVEKVLNYMGVSKDSIIKYYNLIDTSNVDDGDVPYYELVTAMINADKSMLDSAAIQRLDSIIIYFLDIQDYYAAGHAAYTNGLYYYRHSDRKTMTRYFKEAEHYYLKSGKEPPALYYSVLYLSIAYTLYLEHAYELAYQYSYKALPYTVEANIILNLTAVYKNLAFMAPDTLPTSIKNQYYETAISYARQLEDSVILFDIFHYHEELYGDNDDYRIEISKKSCNNTRSKHYAYDVAEYYLDRRQPDSAALYLQIFSADTAKLDWSKNKYYELQSRLYSLNGDDKRAYSSLLFLYQTTQKKLEETPLAETIEILNHYDDLYEREDQLLNKARHEKYNLYVLLSIVVLVLALIIVLILLLYYKKQRQLQQEENEHIKTKHLLELECEQSKRNMMKAELVSVQNILREKLRQRLEFTKKLRLNQFKGKTTDTMPDWVKQMILLTTFTDESKWQEFRQEYNEATHGQLDNLKRQYPALTEADLQYIALSTLGLTVEEICILLGTTNRTIWNRKQTVNKKLNSTDNRENT